MFFSTSRSHTTSSRQQLVKMAILLVVSLGMFVFVTGVSQAQILEPESTGWKLWFSYANDLLLPFAFYFLLCLAERWMQTWQARALLSFTVFVLLEFGQLLYYQVSTERYIGSFDPLDIFMYAMSVVLAAIVEQKVFPRLFKFW